jgi:type VI secretion system VasI family protein
MHRLIGGFLLAGVLALTAWPGSAAAELQGELELCAQVTDDYNRLACFDRVIAEYGLDEPPELRATKGVWQLQTEPSDFGVADYFLYVVATRGIADGQGGRTMPALVIRCVEDVTAVYIDWGVKLGSGEIEMEYRLDDGEITDETWSIATDGQTIGKWRGARAIPFVKQLFDKERLFVRIGDESGSVGTVFKVSGLQQAIQPLRKGCDW